MPSTAPLAVLAGGRLMAEAWYVAAMSKTPERMIAGFTTGERDYIRRELDIFFSPCCASTRVFSPSRLLKNPCRESDASDSMTKRIDGEERPAMRGWDN